MLWSTLKTNVINGEAAWRNRLELKRRVQSVLNVSNESSICEPYYPSLQIFDIDRDNKPFLTALPEVPDLAPRGLHAGRAYKLPQPFSPTSHPSIETLYGSTPPLFVSFAVREQCIALIPLSYVKVWYLSQATILVMDWRLLHRICQGHFNIVCMHKRTYIQNKKSFRQKDTPVIHKIVVKHILTKLIFLGNF